MPVRLGGSRLQTEEVVEELELEFNSIPLPGAQLFLMVWLCYQEKTRNLLCKSWCRNIFGRGVFDGRESIGALFASARSILPVQLQTRSLFVTMLIMSSRCFTVPDCLALKTKNYSFLPVLTILPPPSATSSSMSRGSHRLDGLNPRWQPKTRSSMS